MWPQTSSVTFSSSNRWNRRTWMAWIIYRSTNLPLQTCCYPCWNTVPAQKSLTNSSSSGFEENIGFSVLIWMQRKNICDVKSSVNTDKNAICLSKCLLIVISLTFSVFFSFYLFGEDDDVFTEGVWRADVSSCHAALSRRARRQLTFFKNQSEQWEQGMSGGEGGGEEEDKAGGEKEEEEKRRVRRSRTNEFLSKALNIYCIFKILHVAPSGNCWWESLILVITHFISVILIITAHTKNHVD